MLAVVPTILEKPQSLLSHFPPICSYHHFCNPRTTSVKDWLIRLESQHYPLAKNVEDTLTQVTQHVEPFLFLQLILWPGIWIFPVFLNNQSFVQCLNIFESRVFDLWCSTVVEYFLDVHKVLGLIPCTTKTKVKVVQLGISTWTSAQQSELWNGSQMYLKSKVSALSLIWLSSCPLTTSGTVVWYYPWSADQLASVIWFSLPLSVLICSNIFNAVKFTGHIYSHFLI